MQIQNNEFEPVAGSDEQNLDVTYYASILKKRFLYLLIPFVVVALGGVAAALLWTPVYLSEGRLLVESQQIPADLVRPTVTATAKERIQVIQQRVTTRDNLLALLDKYKLYANDRTRLSRTELLDLMRDNIRIEPINLDQASGARAQTIALKVGFTDQRPDVATQVANELVTLFLNEDARNRTNRAMETTRFLAREAQRLDSDLNAIEAKIVEARKQFRDHPLWESSAGVRVSPVATLKTELAQKRAVYSKAHPEVRRIEAQLAALEKLEAPVAATTQKGITPATATEVLEPLLAQRVAAQKNLEIANDKLAAARLGESLERAQFSERLQVLEQAVAPQKPIKPNRPKIIALAFIGAVMAGLAGVVGIEMFDRTIRGSRDLLQVAGGNSIVVVPYISTKAELDRSKYRWVTVAGAVVLALMAALVSVHVFYRPLDELWPLLVAKYL